ncbi:MAG: CotD family spore coat protein [Bacilli bacterium]
MNFYNESLKPEMNAEMGPMDMGMGMNPCGCCEMPQQPCCRPEPCCSMPMQQPCCPIYECPKERVCHRFINYDVPHIMPCNTRVINHHVYRHIYQPEYTCCEENVVSNVYDRKCC